MVLRACCSVIRGGAPLAAVFPAVSLFDVADPDYMGAPAARATC